MPLWTTKRIPLTHRECYSESSSIVFPQQKTNYHIKNRFTTIAIILRALFLGWVSFVYTFFSKTPLLYRVHIHTYILPADSRFIHSASSASNQIPFLLSFVRLSAYHMPKRPIPSIYYTHKLCNCMLSSILIPQRISRSWYCCCFQNSPRHDRDLCYYTCSTVPLFLLSLRLSDRRPPAGAVLGSRRPVRYFCGSHSPSKTSCNPTWSACEPRPVC